mmetsp:Transcript_8074/g.20089  ORF Transcript_8074/g.20089 Transcript_8074/m.20089 type:complete len:424 (-) Transcript_8074:427-1698(-)
MRRLAGENLDDQTAQRPNVNLLGDFRLRIKEFWRHVAGRPDLVGTPTDMSALHGLRQAEVAKLRVQRVIQHNIHAFEISVHEWRAQAVQKLDALGALYGNGEPLVSGEGRLLLVQQRVQRSVGHELHDDAQVRRIESRANEPRQAGVLESHQVEDLLLEFGQLRRGHLSIRRVKLLDGHLLALVGATVHRAEASGPEDLSEVKVREVQQLGQASRDSAYTKGRGRGPGPMRAVLVDHREGAVLGRALSNWHRGAVHRGQAPWPQAIGAPEQHLLATAAVNGIGYFDVLFLYINDAAVDPPKGALAVYFDALALDQLVPPTIGTAAGESWALPLRRPLRHRLHEAAARAAPHMARGRRLKRRRLTASASLARLCPRKQGGGVGVTGSASQRLFTLARRRLPVSGVHAALRQQHRRAISQRRRWI